MSQAAVIAPGPSNVERERGAAIRAIKVLLFSASIVPSVLAGAVAYRLGTFSMGHFLLLIAAVFLAQAGGDYLYYYFTHRLDDGRDTHTKIFAGWRPLFAEQGLRGRGILVAGFGCLLVDLALGVYFAWHTGPAVLPLALVGGLIAVFFTPLMLRGLKEPVIFVAFGPLTVVGMVLVLTGGLSLQALVASLPIACLVTLVAHLKSAHFDLVDQQEGQVVVRLSRGTLMVLTVGAYGSLIAGVVAGQLPAPALLGMVSLPWALRVLQVTQRKSSPLVEYLWAVVRSTVVLVLTGVAMAVGYGLSVMWS